MATTVKKEKTQFEQLLDLVKYMVNEGREFKLSSDGDENSIKLEYPSHAGKLALSLNGWKYIED